ncbi:MAG: DUF3365 domain-containing protein [Thermodesulfobacteriota bacterium]
MGIRNQFLLVIALVSILTLGVLGYLSYTFSQQEALKEAQNKVAILSSYIKSSHHYAMKKQIPMLKELLGKERFYPDLMSVFVQTRNVAEVFNKEQPGYTIKNATVDPLWEPNKATSQELTVIKKFKVNKGKQRDTGIMHKDGGKFYYQATPIVISKRCLRCHGDPLNAPKDQVELYGTEHGYGWVLNDIPSALFIYVPVSEAMQAARDNALKLVATGGGCLVVAILFLMLHLGVKVVNPIVDLSRKAEKISLGKSLDQSVTVSPNKEIGQLSRSVDRLRMSMGRFMRRR